MRRLTLSALGVVTGLGALATGFAAPASAADTASGPGPYHETVFSLTAHQTQVNSLDLDGAGTTQGDEIVVSGELLQSSTQVGTFGEVCTLTRTAPGDEADLLCQGSLALPQGQLTIQGRFTITGSGPGNIDLAITGGTGLFRSARGYIHAVNTDATHTNLTVHLLT
ncbi:dirigent protein [Streptomyces sp. NPDC002004]